MSEVDPFDPQAKDNPWLERTLRREMFYLGTGPKEDKAELKKKLGGKPRCFVIRRPETPNIYGGVRFWLKSSFSSAGVTERPFYSGKPLSSWIYKKKDSKGIERVRFSKDPPSDDVLGKFVSEHHDLIAPQRFNNVIQYWPDLNEKKNFEEVFAIEAYEVVFEFLNGKYVTGDDGKTKYTVNPTPWILELRRTWWDKLSRRVLYPREGDAGEEPTVIQNPDGTTKEVSKKFTLKLPTADKSVVMLMLTATKGEKYEEDNSKVDYDISFSESLMVNSKAITPVEPLPSNPDGTIDWKQIYPPMVEEDAKKIVEAHTKAMAEAAAFDHGEPAAPQGEPAAAAGTQAKPALTPEQQELERQKALDADPNKKAKSAADDIPF